MTEGACETEKRQKAEAFHICDFGFDSPFQTFGDRFEFEKTSVTNFRQKAKEKGERGSRVLLQSPSAPIPSRREPMFARVFLCRRRIFRLFFGAFQTILQALRASSLPEGAYACACFFSAQKGNFLQNFGKYRKNFSGHTEHISLAFRCREGFRVLWLVSKVNPSAAFAQGSHRSVRFSIIPLVKEGGQTRFSRVMFPIARSYSCRFWWARNIDFGKTAFTVTGTQWKRSTQSAGS